MRADLPSTAAAAPINVTIISLDGHLGSTVRHAERRLQQELPGLALSIHPASDWGDDADALERCERAIARADIIVCTMLFLEAHIEAVLPALQARAPHCDAFVGAMSGAEIVKLTRMGKLTMGGELKGPMAMLKKLRGSKSSSGKGGRNSGAKQMKTLRNLPRILKWVPGTAQDLRLYFIVLQCWLAGSEENVACLVRSLIHRYADGDRLALRGAVREREPAEYPEVGVYHPDMPRRIGSTLADLPARPTGPTDTVGTVGVLVMRSYVLAENTRHYDAVIAALEARRLRVIPVFASGLDGRPAIDAFFRDRGRTDIDCMISLTGFSLVGGPAYNDSQSAIEALTALDVPYIAAHPSEFQSLDKWAGNARGLTPIETTMMVALPELDGATGPIVYAGQKQMGGEEQDKFPIAERIERLATRTERLVRLRRSERFERKLGVVLFNFPPNAGAVGTAAYLSVFESLHNTLVRLAEEGYDVEVPENADALRERLLGGNAGTFGTDANVLATVSNDDHVRHTPWLEQIEAQWGPAPGQHLSDGRGIHVLGLQLGKVTIGLQPGFGYEGDPMRLLFEGGFAPTHAFSAFYRYLADTVQTDALLHFGTHGALEFMPGKQSGLSGECWPDRLIGDLPNVYLYAANNPSEATIAKRRGNATLVSYLTPSVTEAGLYKGLADIRSAINQYYALARHDGDEAQVLLDIVTEACATLELEVELDLTGEQRDTSLARLSQLLHEYELQLIPAGLHVVGQHPAIEERVDLLHAFRRCADAQSGEATPDKATIRTVLERARQIDGDPAWVAELLEMDAHMTSDAELSSLVHALDAGYIPAAPGGDVLRDSATLPAGRNIHGFDPFRMPTQLAQRQGEAAADLLLERHVADTGRMPRTVAFVLWGSDNMKNEGVPIAQVMALMGARPRFDAFGKLVGAELISLEELGRPRIDVLTTLSGVFRDLLPLQTKMLAEAAVLASRANEPSDMNHVRAHTLAWLEKHGGDFATAALRVFSNADGAYGANVNLLVDSGNWQEEDELAETYANRKCYAFGVDGTPVRQVARLEAALEEVDLAYQNLESVELGVTQLDYYFDTLGGINSMVKRVRGEAVTTYIGDQTQSGTGAGTVRSLAEQVALETRTRMLNPTWYEGQLKHGYEGVRTIETSLTNTLGWSATTGQVAPWVYKQVAETFVLDGDMRERLASLNPTASARLANRLIEASERNYWSPSDDVLQALQDAGDELEDRLEGVMTGAAA